jgi:hypothetical protein
MKQIQRENFENRKIVFVTSSAYIFNYVMFKWGYNRQRLKNWKN